MARPYIPLKRAMDICVSLGVLVFFLPVLALIWVAIRIESPGPGIFLDSRIGLGGRPFTMLKFRTMQDGASAQSLGKKLMIDDPRITHIGKLLRAFSLDELPQLINVLRGEMSLVGPRPILDVHLKELNEFQRQRLSVRPGITGLAQVNGRNSIPWPERLKWDVEYANHCSLRLDLAILARTAFVVLGRQGISSEHQMRDGL